MKWNVLELNFGESKACQHILTSAFEIGPLVINHFKGKNRESSLNFSYCLCFVFL